MAAVAAPIALPILTVSIETPRTRGVRLALGGRVFPFLAGQAVELGTHGQSQRRPYSIACSPGQARERDSLEFLVQMGEAGSAGPHLDPLRPGGLVNVGPPLGGFVFPDAWRERDLLLVAGGTGIAPLRAMMWHTLETRPAVRPGLLYSARSHEEFAFGAELRGLAAEGRIRLHETVTGTGDLGWSGSRGRIARAHLESLVGSVPPLCFVCGPPAFAADVGALLAAFGVPRERILTETWG